MYKGRLFLLMVVLAVAGCVGAESATSVTLSGTYTVDNNCDKTADPCKSTIEPNSRVVVVWSLGDKDIYVAGEGIAGDGVWTVTLPPTLPEAANYYGLIGVGRLVVEDSSHPLALKYEQGRAVSKDGVVQGRSIDAAIIWTNGQFADMREDSWMGAFGAGYSCGRCVETEGVLDAYEEVPCDDLHIILSVGYGCNWT